MTETPDHVTDPWAWAREEPGDPELSFADAQVTAVVVTHRGAAWLRDLLDSVAAQSILPADVVVAVAGEDPATGQVLDAAAADGLRFARVATEDRSFGAAVDAALAAHPLTTRWLWLLHDDAVAEPRALEQLLRRGSAADAPAAVAPLLLQASRRGVGDVIGEMGQTVTRSGLVVGAGLPGVLDMGQLESRPVLGASTCGLLVRAESWDRVGGLVDSLASAVQGLDLGARLHAAGESCVTAPGARVVHLGAGGRGLRGGPPVTEASLRAYGMAFDRIVGRKSRGAGSLSVSSHARAAALLAGKDLPAARAEREALAAWRTGQETWDEAAERFREAAADGPGVSALAGLRPTRGRRLAGALEDAAGRVGDWASDFTDRGPALGLDHLTGDDFAGAAVEPHGRRWAPWAVVLALLVVGCLVAARGLFSLAPLAGPQLLRVPDAPALRALYDSWVTPVAGGGVSSGAAWQGALWLASLPTFGHPDLLVTLVLLGSVPLTFLLARRLLNRLVSGGFIALAGALAYALVPVTVGAVGSGQWGAVAWSVLLPVLVGTGLDWAQEGPARWRRAAAFGWWLALMTALMPLTWPVGAAAALVIGRRTRTPWPRVVLASAAPAVWLLGPWTAALVASPGRLLTGIEPALTPQTAAPWWDLLLARPASAALPPWWLGVLVAAGWWLLALVGGFRRPAVAGWLVAVAAAAGAVAVGISRVPVGVPGHLTAIPQATEWTIGLAAALVGAACLGLDGLGRAAREESFGVRQLTLATIGLVAAAVVLAGIGWWVTGATSELRRVDQVEIPPFIRKDQSRGATRTLAIEVRGDSVAWALHEDNFARLGDAERGLVMGGDPAALTRAASVVHRIVSSSGDEQIIDDLAWLGVGHVWIQGGSDTLRVDTSNIPGMGVGSVDGDTATWTIAHGGRVTLQDGSSTTVLDPDHDVPAGSAQRTLVLAAPADDRWSVTVGGVLLEPVAGADRPTFQLGSHSGPLQVSLDGGPAWWAWLQLAGVLVLAGLAAPGRTAAPGGAPAATGGARRAAEETR